MKNTKPKKITKKPVSKSGLSIKLFNLRGQQQGSVSLPKEIFDVSASPNLMAQYLKVYLTNQRQGTASTKTRAEIRGSTRKIYRQKGTGRARHGAKSAPIFVGGGVAFGPKPRNYSLKINKKQKKKALFGSLSLKTKEGAIIGLSSNSLKTEPKTKIVADFLRKVDFYNKKTLFVFPKLEKNSLVLASRNIPDLNLTDARSINPYQVLNNKKIVFVADSLEVLKTHFLKKDES